MATLQLTGPAPKKQPSQRPVDKWSPKGFIRFGLIVVAILVGGLGTWGATAKLAGAVVATGELRVTAKQQVVQHPDGGVVGDIFVKDGDLVEGGEVLVELSGTSLRSELAALESQIYELMARRGRLTAEQIGQSDIDFDDELLAAAAENEEVASLVRAQEALFRARIETMNAELKVMGERQSQTDEQIEGAQAELASLSEQSALIAQELKSMMRLRDQGLAREDRVKGLEREAARLRGQSGQMKAQIAQLKGQISELEVEKIRMRATRIEEANTQLTEIGFRELELKERRIQLQEQLDRLAIRAPRSGIVYDMRIFALKSVIRPAEPILFIVPIDTGMVIEAKVEPISIDQVYIGQEAALRFSAFNSRTTPELVGHVTQKSADSFQDEQTGITYYKVEIQLNEGELAKLEDLELIAGMPVETFIQTDERTPFNYLMRPLTDYINRAWREE
ncbi:MAG: HlyD family type I secretion periplasmic adaptor subunit [Paracoccaceae bacterium]